MDSRTKKTNNKRFVRYSEGAEMYSMSVSKFMQLNLDCIDVCESIVGQLVYLYNVLKINVI